MADTSNTPGVLCYPDFSADVGWKQALAGFTDLCWPTKYIQIFNSNTQPGQWKQFEGSGVAVPVSTGPSIPLRWKGLYPKLSLPVGVLSVTIDFLIQTIGGNPATQIQMEIIFLAAVGPNFSEKWIFNRINKSKKSPFNADFCQPIQPLACTMSGAPTFNWWPSCNGTAAAGPTTP